MAGAAAAAAPLAVGAGAMSSVTGLATHYMTGAPVTPFLHIPGDADDLTPPFQRGSIKLTADEQTERDDRCEEQLRSDDITCQTYAAMYGKSKKDRARIATICKSTAMDRYAQCLVAGPASVHIPLYTGR